MIPSPYHLSDGGKLIEIGIENQDFESFRMIVWRCEKCKQVIYSDDDTDKYGFK